MKINKGMLLIAMLAFSMSTIAAAYAFTYEYVDWDEYYYNGACDEYISYPYAVMVHVTTGYLVPGGAPAEIHVTINKNDMAWYSDWLSAGESTPTLTANGQKVTVHIAGPEDCEIHTVGYVKWTYN